MPLDPKIKKYYPFVGMKCTGDKITILNEK